MHLYKRHNFCNFKLKSCNFAKVIILQQKQQQQNYFKLKSFDFMKILYQIDLGIFQQKDVIVQ